MNPLFRIGTRVKVKTWDEIAAYTGVDFTEDEFPTYHLRNLRTGQMVEREPRAPYQFRDWMLKLTW